MHVVLVTREVWPLVEGGGIARYVADAGAALAGAGERVTVLTSSRWAERHAELVAAGAPGAAPEGVEWAWVPEPGGDLTPLWSHQHAWSLACWNAVHELCAREAVDVVEFEDYGGAAAVTLDAARTRHPALRGVTVAVRLHTSWEMTQVLDGIALDGTAERTVMALERHSLAFADVLLAPNERTLDAYTAFYGDELARAAVGPMPPLEPEESEGAVVPPDANGPLRLLFVGRLQRLKGVEELVRAIVAASPGCTLTLAGGDTETAPGGGSMHEHLAAIAAGDERIAFAGRIGRADLPAAMRAHHVVVVPSYFEAHGYVVREALAQNRPVLGAAAGGVAEALADPDAGRLVPARDELALAAAIERLADDRETLDAAIRDGAPAAAGARAPGRDAFLAAYAALERPGGEPALDADRVPLTAVVTVGRGERDLPRTLASLEAAGADAGAVVVVVAAAGPELVPTELLGRVHALALPDGDDRDLAALRRAALEHAMPGGLVLLLRAGDEVDPAFVRRARRAMAGNEALAYVTAHAPGRLPSCAPLGNFDARLVPELQVAGTVVLARADAAEAIAHDGDTPLLAIAAERRYGAVLPERLIRLGRVPAPVERVGAAPWPPEPGETRAELLLSASG